MYNLSNFVVNLNQNSLINLITNDTTDLIFKIENKDLDNQLFNLSFEITLGDGIELLNSSIDYSSSLNNNTFTFTNIKDLAPNELNFSFSIEIKLNPTNTSGEELDFDSLISCSFKAFADTMPRGNYDIGNEIIENTTNFSIKVSKYIITKEIPPVILLGETYTSKIIIKTAFNSGITFDTLYDFLGNGIQYLGNMIIEGFNSNALINVIITNPTNDTNSYILTWNNVEIPENSIVEISFKFKANEKFYKNGLIDGLYIENNTSILNELSWSINNESFLLQYIITALEILIKIESSSYLVDVYSLITYKIMFYCNLYHGLLNLTGFLTTSDGQILADESSPIMFTSKDISAAGITKATWNIGNIDVSSSATITIDSNISNQYIGTNLDILAGDTFTTIAECNAVSLATNKTISAYDSLTLNSRIPEVNKTIINYYYRDNTPKSHSILAPGDFIEYQTIYDSSNIEATIGRIKFYDFYPYVTKDILNINYNSSSINYLTTSGTALDPYGVFWFYPELNDENIITLNYKTQLDYQSFNNVFTSNLFKIQLLNSNGVAFSNRSQVNFKIGSPNIVINKSVFGNNPNRIKIDETYTVNIVIENKENNIGITDAFNINLTETIDENLIIIPESINASINENSLITNLSNNIITLTIDRLGISEQLIFSYVVKIPQTLGPNQKFNLKTETTNPYSQNYDPNLENFQYDNNNINKTIKLKSQNINLSLNTDEVNKIIGDIVSYTFNINIPIGQRLSNFYALILLPNNQEYLNEATLNGEIITANFENNTIVFPIINDIDTTSSSLFFSYEIKCKINNSIVSTSNPIYTLETYYGNLNYLTLTNENKDMGLSSTLKINHPYISLDIGSYGIKNGFIEPYSTDIYNFVYTKISLNNLGNVLSKNIELVTTLPDNLIFKTIDFNDFDMTYSFDDLTKELTFRIDTLDRLSEKFIIIESQINDTVLAETVLLITSKISHYYNSLSETKVYNSPNIYTNEVFVNSLFTFTPLSFYSLTGSDSAINLSKPGEETSIEYILTNTGQGIDEYSLNIMPIDYTYDLYIGSDFITNVPAYTSLSISPPQLSNISKNTSRYIKLVYTIPSDTLDFYSILMITVTSNINIGNSKTIPTTLQDP